MVQAAVKNGGDYELLLTVIVADTMGRADENSNPLADFKQVIDTFLLKRHDSVTPKTQATTRA